jgi:hypothetical protein
VQNLRLAIERQLSRAPQLLRPETSPRRPSFQRERAIEHENQSLGRKGRRLVWVARFAEVKRLQQAGKTLGAIVTATGLNWRTVSKWATCATLPERGRMDPRPRDPVQFADYLAKRWTEGCRNGRHLLLEIREQGYPGSRAQLERLLWEWRRYDALPAAQLAVERSHEALGSMTAMPPFAASMLCVTPRARLTARQASRVDLLKERLPGFADMRQLAMRFGGIPRGNNPATLDAWLADVRRSGFSASVVLHKFLAGYRRGSKRHSRRMEQRTNESQINKLKSA